VELPVREGLVLDSRRVGHLVWDVGRRPGVNMLWFCMQIFSPKEMGENGDFYSKLYSRLCSNKYFVQSALTDQI
jgi:hypothetical protein